MLFRRLLFITIMISAAPPPIIAADSHAKDVNPDILLRCIAYVESHNDQAKIGKQGERSRYQFMPQTWALYSKVPFSQIGKTEHQMEVERVAYRHIFTIKTAIVQRNWEITPYTVALGWNGGPNKISYLLCHRDYAKRVENLYWHFLRNHP